MPGDRLSGIAHTDHICEPRSDLIGRGKGIRRLMRTTADPQPTAKPAAMQLERGLRRIGAFDNYVFCV